MVMGLRHIHSASDSIFFLVAVLLAPHKLISFGVSLLFSGVSETLFGEAVRFATGIAGCFLRAELLACSFLIVVAKAAMVDWSSFLSVCLKI